MRIVAEQLYGNWSAWFAEPLSPHCYNGDTAIEAIKRLIDLTPECTADFEDFTTETESCRRNRMVMVLQSQAAVCRECGGTGKYVGLNIIEDCHACTPTDSTAC